MQHITVYYVFIYVLWCQKKLMGKKRGVLGTVNTEEDTSFNYISPSDCSQEIPTLTLPWLHTDGVSRRITYTKQEINFLTADNQQVDRLLNSCQMMHVRMFSLY